MEYRYKIYCKLMSSSKMKLWSITNDEDETVKIIEKLQGCGAKEIKLEVEKI